MPSRYQIWMDGAPAAGDLLDRISSLEFEENADAPGSLQIRLPISRSNDGDLTEINEPGFQPFANIAVTVGTEDGLPTCVFDGYVLGQKVHIESGVRASWLEVYAQDASWLMNLEEKAREWANTTDSTASASIFGEYGITPAPANLDDDSGMYTEDAHTLMQRGTDFDFLKGLARRGGRLFRVVGGPLPGTPVGVFAPPDLAAEPVATLRPNDPEAPNVAAIEFEWDVMRPGAVVARQALFTDPSPGGASGDAAESGLEPLDARPLSAFATRPRTVMLTTPADDAGQLGRRASALLRESEWFVRCTGEVDLAALRVVLRAGDVARVDTVGSVHSGKYLVWSVRHRIDPTTHKMQFTLVRNAVGPLPSGAGGLLGGLL